MSFQISSATKGIIGAYNQTISDPNYFNTLWGVTDSVVVEVADPTPDEISSQVAAYKAAQALQALREPILAQLAAIDLSSIRAIRTGDTARKASWEAMAEALRTQLATIGNG